MLVGLVCALGCWVGRAAPAQVAVPDEVRQAEQQRVRVMAQASQTALSIFGSGGAGGGSGVVISPDGYALSNFHVVKPAGDYMRCGMADGSLYDAVVVGVDPTGDVALIKLLGRDDFPHAPLGDSDALRVGHWCFAVGNPFLLATDFQPTVTYGMISGVHRYQYPAGTLLEYTDCIQIDASINPGNSGGPLFNMQGELIGINGRGSFEKRGRVNVGVAYAISINQIKNFLGCLHSGRIVDHATLGAVVSSDEEGRVTVTNVLESSDAYRRGLRYKDEIVSFAGRPVHSANAFKNVLGIFPRGWRVPISFLRDQQRYDRLVRLAGVHSPEELIAKVQAPDIQPPDQPPRQEDQPRQKPELPRLQMPREQPVPAAAATLLQARRGYANYYFNQLHQNRVWSAQLVHGDFSALTGPWILGGELDGGGAVEFELRPEEILGQLPDAPGRVDLQQDLAGQSAPPNSGGLLLALAMWQRLLVRGPEKFGEVYYQGSAPLPGRDELADVLVATHDVVETHFFFDPHSGYLLGLEMFPDSNVDPCEIYFDDYRDVQGRQLPHRLVVHHGDAVFAQIRLDRCTLVEHTGDDT